MTSKWEPVLDLLLHMVDDDDLLLRWGLLEYGDVRSADGRHRVTARKCQDLLRLSQAMAQRVVEEQSSRSE